VSEKIKLLVIDDMPFILKATKLLLEKAGFSVETAIDGESGMIVWKQWQPECVLLDLMMPGKSGWEVLKEMTHSKDYIEIPVFIYSAKDDPSARTKAKDLGAAGFILKPLDPKITAEQIKRTVDEFRAKSPSP